MTWIDIVGYVASVLVAASFFMKSLVRLRWVSLTGSAIFSLYGALIGAWPVVVTNLVVVGANILNLIRLRRSASSINAVPMRPESPFLQDYLGRQRHRDHQQST